MKATPTKDIQTTVQSLAYGFYMADKNITTNGKVSDVELRRYTEANGFPGDAPEVAMKKVLDFAQSTFEKAKNANVPREDVNKALGMVMREIAHAAGSSAGKGFKDGDALSAAEYATLSATAKAVVDAARKYPGWSGEALFTDVTY